MHCFNLFSSCVFFSVGIIFVWPQRKKYYYAREFALALRILSQTFFWLYVANVFPCGSVLPLSKPPWKYKPPLPKPENRDYIIEPDWDSQYNWLFMILFCFFLWNLKYIFFIILKNIFYQRKHKLYESHPIYLW